MKEGVNSTYIESLDKPVTRAQLLKIIKNLKVGKAYGEDLITNSMLKASADLHETAMLKLFNMYLDYSIFPEAWSHGYIVPMFKSAVQEDVSNYRPITISSCLGKIVYIHSK